MIVQAVWEFDVDTSDFSPEYVDIPGFCKDLTKLEMESLIKKGDLSADDFQYIVKREDEKYYHYTDTKFIKGIDVRRVIRGNICDHYYIEVTLNELPDSGITGYESVICFNKPTGVISGNIGVTYYAMKDFETYKEYESEFNNLMLKIINKEKNNGKE